MCKNLTKISYMKILQKDRNTLIEQSIFARNVLHEIFEPAKLRYIAIYSGNRHLGLDIFGHFLQ